MALMKWTDVRCDFEGCLMWCNGDRDGVAARRQARRYGWTHVRGKDFCPEHSSPNRRPALDDRGSTIRIEDVPISAPVSVTRNHTPEGTR